jgi:hypothetical protein
VDGIRIHHNGGCLQDYIPDVEYRSTLTNHIIGPGARLAVVRALKRALGAFGGPS